MSGLALICRASLSRLLLLKGVSWVQLLEASSVVRRIAWCR